MHQIRFPVRSGFHETVKQRVAQYFADSRQVTTGDRRLFVKTGVILALLAGPYALLVFGSTSLLVTMLALFALAQGCAQPPPAWSRGVTWTQRPRAHRARR